MRRSYLLLVAVFVFISQVIAFAQNGYSQSHSRTVNLKQPITISLKGATLKQALNLISKKTSAAFFYEPNILPKGQLYSFEIDSEPLGSALSKILDRANISWVLVNKNLIALKAKKVDPPKGAGTISGSVRDATTGDPLPGAIVFLKGTSLGASTDMNGYYTISDVPSGSYTVQVSYVGYDTRDMKVVVESGKQTLEKVKLTPVGVKGKAVVVTAQASGQNAAINQQLSSQNIVNVVSAARIQQLPDQNAAESVGRLPGVFLVRSYGEGAMVAIRGLRPKYNRVEVDGVEMPSNQTGNRAVDMSMISSNMLSGIELYKTVTPNMNAAVLGGTVNFQIKEAQATPNGLPLIHLQAQGGYDHLQNRLGDYKFSGTIEKRFFGNRFGVMAQALVQRENLTADIFGAGYVLQKPTDYSNPGQLIMQSLNLDYRPTTKNLYNGTLVLDYKWNGGKVDVMNFLSRGLQKTETFSQAYKLPSSQIDYGVSYYPQTLNVIMNILDFRQKLLAFNMDLKLSHAYTENVHPGYWSIGFAQHHAGLTSVPLTASPTRVAQIAGAHADPASAVMSGLSTNSSFTRQRNFRGSVDFKRNFTLSDLVSASVQFGGEYKITNRSYAYLTGNGSIFAGGVNTVRADVISHFPWMAENPWNLSTNGFNKFPMGMFLDPSMSFGNFLGGEYRMYGSPTNVSLLSQVLSTVITFQKDKPAISGTVYSPDEYGDVASNYSGHEYENGEYAMATIHLGNKLTLIPGVRYQGLRTSYKAAVILAAYNNNPYPAPFPHTDTTVSYYHGYWLPDVILRYKPLSWLQTTLAYTNTLTYPDFSSIAPKIHVFISTVNWNDFLLKPAHAQNYDLAISAYNNSIGLLTVDPFYKRIENLIFSSGTVSITDPSQYPGLPPYTKGYLLTGTDVNNPHPVNVWGIGLNWQTHFWYLPGFLTGLVMNVNYTHIFSGAQYPFIITKVSGYPQTTTYIDTSYTDRLIDQPSNIVNLSIGYDYRGFSVRGSMIYQQSVFNGTNFWPQLRQYKATYVRWDLAASQKLPWFGLQVYLDVNNLNGEPDITVVSGTGFPTSEQSYGMSADLGFRWFL